jgi:hypothetical protein
MGLFSGRYEYFAFVGTSSLFELDQRPDTHKQKILETTIHDGNSFAEAIVFSLNTDWYARTKAMMRYASQENGYVRGFPTARLVRLEIPDKYIIDAIERETGNRPEELLLNEYGGTFDEDFFIKLTLQQNWLPGGDGINADIFDWQNGPPTESIWCETFENIEIPVWDGSAYVTAPNVYEFARKAEEDPPIFDPNDPGGLDPVDPGLGDPIGPINPIQLEQFIYELQWTYEDPNTSEPKGFIVNMNLVSWALTYLNEDIILRVIYRLPGEDCPRYWAYIVGSNEDPILESHIRVIKRREQFLPVAVLMQDKVWFDEDPESDLAKTTNRLLSKLNLSGTEIKEDFIEQENEDDASGDEGRVDAEKWDVFVHCAVPINSQIQASKRYLHEFFSRMKLFDRWNREKYEEYLVKRETQDPNDLFSMIQPITEVPIQEAGDGGYNVTYAWSYIEQKTNPGRILKTANFETFDAPLGHTNVEIIERNDSATLNRYQEIIDLFHGEGSPIGPETEDPETDGYHDIVYIEHQTLTPGTEQNPDYQVTRTLIMGLSMAYRINTSLDLKQGYRYRYAVPELFGTQEETNEFRIPILFPALKQIKAVDREDVITDGLCASVFLVKAVKQKWYQTGFFKFIIILIAVILIVTLVFAKVGGGLIGIATSLAGANATAATITLIYSVLSFAVGFVISFAGSLIGGTAGMLFSLIGNIALMGAGMAANYGTSWVNAWKTMATNATASWGGAMTFLTNVSNIASGILEVYSSYQLEQLQGELEDFLKSAKEKQEELEDAWNSLGVGPDWLDPMSLTRAFIMPPAETPRAFFSRTISLNPGLMGYDLITDFAEMATMPPEKPGDKDIIEAQFETMKRQRGQ